MEFKNKLENEKVLLELKDVEVEYWFSLKPTLLFSIFPNSVSIRNVLITDQRILLPIVSYKSDKMFFNLLNKLLKIPRENYSSCFVVVIDNKNNLYSQKIKWIKSGGAHLLIEWELHGEDFAIQADDATRKIKFKILKHGKEIADILKVLQIH